jgi:hypothetical protein
MTRVSNIRSVTLHNDDSVTIEGAFEDMAGCNLTLLHVWLSQSQTNGKGGVGLAQSVDSALGKIPNNNHTWKYKQVPTKDSERFRDGPAIVSAIAVFTQRDDTQDAIQWTRSLTLVKGQAC